MAGRQTGGGRGPQGRGYRLCQEHVLRRWRHQGAVDCTTRRRTGLAGFHGAAQAPDAAYREAAGPGRRRHQRCRTRGRPGNLPDVQLPGRLEFPQGTAGLPGSDAGVVARSRRCGAQHSHAGAETGAAAVAGRHPARSGQSTESRPHRRHRGRRRAADRRGQKMGPGQSGCRHQALGQKGLQDPRWRYQRPGDRPDPGGFLAHAVRQDPGAAPRAGADPVRGPRCGSGGLRHGAAHRKPGPGGAAAHPGRQEPDEQHLPADEQGQWRYRSAGGHRQVEGEQSGDTRCRHDGAGHCLRLCHRRTRCGAQGRGSERRRQGQGLHRTVAGPARRQGQNGRGSEETGPGSDPVHHQQR